MDVVVIGAGAFGTWTARWLLRRGASVTLVDQYGAGNSLASSGDESRMTRSAHGVDELYPSWQRRSLEQWLALGGSGHGFKHAPVVGEYASGLIMGADVGELHPPDDRFSLRPRTAGVGMRTSGTAPSS